MAKITCNVTIPAVTYSGDMTLDKPTVTVTPERTGTDSGSTYGGYTVDQDTLTKILMQAINIAWQEGREQGAKSGLNAGARCVKDALQNAHSDISVGFNVTDD